MGYPEQNPVEKLHKEREAVHLENLVRMFCSQGPQSSRTITSSYEELLVKSKELAVNERYGYGKIKV